MGSWGVWIISTLLANESGPDVYVLLVGHPTAPVALGLPALSSVDEDVLRMAEMFSVLSPRRMEVLVRLDEAQLALHPELEPRPPTLAALEQAAGRIQQEATLRSSPAQIYVYFSGHGRRRLGDVIRTDLFLEPEPGARDSASREGVIDGAMLGERVLDRLAPNRVHLIVDACQSAFLLETRGGFGPRRRVRKRFDEPRTNTTRFVETHPNVGAILATNGSQATFERSDLGGLFSYAVRSAALGQADFDEDGVVTYAEMEAVIPQVLAGQGGSGPATVLGVGGDKHAAFLDYRRVSGSRLLFGPGRHEVFTAGYLPYAVIHPAKEMAAYALLPLNHVYATMTRTTTSAPVWRRFAAGAATMLLSRLGATDAVRLKGDTVFSEGDLLPVPVRRELTSQLDDPSPAPLSYLGLGLDSHVLTFPAGGPGEMNIKTGAGLSGRLGAGPWHGILELAWNHGAGELTASEVTFVADAFETQLGVGYVVFDGQPELQVAALAGPSVTFKKDSDGQRQEAISIAALVEGRVVVPVVGAVSGVGNLGFGAQWLCVDGCGATSVDFSFRTGVGFEWELPLSD
ncbi:MAG: hypothetical protein HY791_33430 [Deltaproteobacteria bacterium]|nr:hypothetical protein [Deltaproteobacteria bacterium]